MSKKDFFNNQKNVKKFFFVFYVMVIVSIFAELFIQKHTYFPWEEFPFFYASFGFVAFVFLILIAKHVLRPIVKKNEDYYDD